MKLSDTYIAWTAEWLGYFEDWLATGEWAGGGRHPGDHHLDRNGLSIDMNHAGEA